jgi:hypothetical protein
MIGSENTPQMPRAPSRKPVAHFTRNDLIALAMICGTTLLLALLAAFNHWIERI